MATDGLPPDDRLLADPGIDLPLGDGLTPAWQRAEAG